MGLDGFIRESVTTLREEAARLASDVLATIDGSERGLSLAGTLQVSLAPGTPFGRYPLATCGGALTATAALAGIPPGTPAHLSTATPGKAFYRVEFTP